MKKQLRFRHSLALLLILFPFFSSAYYDGDVAGYTAGGAPGAVSWKAGNWAIYNTAGGGWIYNAAYVPASTDTVYILNGDTMNATSSGDSCYNLIVESGGILYANSASNNYIEVYGTILTCNGKIGNGATFDGISFDIDGNNCTISGTGTFNACHIREINSAGNTTNLSIQMNTTLTFGPSAGGYKNSSLYNHSNNTIFNVTFAAGTTANFASYSAGNNTNMSIAGSDGTQTLRGGTITINGTVIVSGYSILTTASTSNPYACAWVINNGGLLETNDIYTNVSGVGSGVGGHSLTINSGGKMQITATPFSSVFYTSNNTYNLNTNSTVEYNGAGAQTIDNNLTYGNLTLSGGVANTKTAAGTLNINGNLTIVTPDTLVPNTAINVGGNWTNYSSKSFKYTGSTVTFNGNNISSDTITTTGGENFANLIINNPNGNVYLHSKADINTGGILTLTQGLLYSDTAATNFYMALLNGASVTGANNNSFVYGKVSRQGNSAFTFPVGKGNEYRPIEEGTLTATAIVIAQYFYQNPTAAYDTSKRTGIDHVSGVEYWTLTAGSIVTIDSVTLQWDTYSGGVTDTANLLIAYDPTPNWLTLGHQATTGTLTKGTLSSSSSLTTATNKTYAFTFGSSSSQPNNPLPVSLISFIATPAQNDVLLKWTTASEINDDYFTIEKSKDAEVFTGMGEIKGAGNSTHEINYAYIDAAPSQGLSYYRLKQTDFNGNYYYSQTIAVNYNKQQTTTITLFPNPTADKTYINVSLESITNTPVKNKTYTLHVFDISGREVMPPQAINFSYGMLQTLDVTQLPKGVYLLRLNDDEEVQRTSLVKE